MRLSSNSPFTTTVTNDDEDDDEAEPCWLAVNIYDYGIFGEESDKDDSSGDVCNMVGVVIEWI